MEEKKEKFSSRLPLIILMILVFVIIVLVFCVVMVFLRKGDEEVDTVEGDNTIDFSQEILNIDEEVSRGLAEAETPEEKAKLHLERAGRVYNMISETGIDKWDLICDDAYVAEELSPSSVSASLINTCESWRGNEELANKYLEIARERSIARGVGAK